MAQEITVPEVPEASYEYQGRAPELSPEPIDKRPIVYGIIAAVIIILLFGGIGVALFIYPAAAAVLRDIFIIFLGLGAFVIILLLIALVVITAYLVLKINDLVQLLNREVRPVLANLQQAATRVQGTTTFISEQAVQPIITTASAVAGVRAVFGALFRRD